MSVSFDVIQLTDSYAKIKLGDLPTERTLYIDALLWESSSGNLIANDQYEIYLYSNDYYIIEFNNLDQQTWYNCRFTICYYDYYNNGGTLVDGGWIDDSFQTQSYSPGAQGQFSCSSTNNSITVTISGLSSYDQIVYSLYDSSYARIDRDTSYNTTYTFTGLSPLTNYYITVFYRYNGYPQTIYDTQGREYCPVLTESGGGGGSWYYNNVSPMAISTSTTPRSESQNFTAQNGLFFTFYCDQNGTIDIYSSSPSGGPLKSYLGDINNSYDPDNGIPYSYDYFDTGSFSYTINVTSGEVYYLWVTSKNNSSFTLNIDFTATVIAPTYTASVSGNSIIFNVFNRGSYYLRYYVKLTSNNNEIYDSYPYQTVTSKTIDSLSWSTSYTVNVGYSEYSTGNVTWIGSQTLTTGSAPVTNDGKVWIFNGSSWVRAKPYIFTGSSWEPASAYVFNGSQWKKTKG